MLASHVNTRWCQTYGPMSKDLLTSSVLQKYVRLMQFQMRAEVHYAKLSSKCKIFLQVVRYCWNWERLWSYNRLKLISNFFVLVEKKKTKTFYAAKIVSKELIAHRL